MDAERRAKKHGSGKLLQSQELDGIVSLDPNTWFDAFFGLASDLSTGPVNRLLKRAWFLLLLAPRPLHVLRPVIEERQLESLLDDSAYLDAALALFAVGDTLDLRRSGAKAIYRATLTVPEINLEGSADHHEPARAILFAWCDAILLGLVEARSFGDCHGTRPAALSYQDRDRHDTCAVEGAAERSHWRSRRGRRWWTGI